MPQGLAPLCLGLARLHTWAFPSSSVASRKGRQVPVPHGGRRPRCSRGAGGGEPHLAGSAKRSALRERSVRPPRPRWVPARAFSLRLRGQLLCVREAIFEAEGKSRKRAGPNHPPEAPAQTWWVVTAYRLSASVSHTAKAVSRGPGVRSSQGERGEWAPANSKRIDGDS